jgi:glycosyltransferase involved in cell wall biosynthesis
MNLTETTISIIIPTHNRVHSLKRLLDQLGVQTYPGQLMEVIVVANSCTDTTVFMLQNYKAPFKLCSSELYGYSLAEARNKGASLATGSLFIFMDDNVYPSDGFVNAHMLAHQNKENSVVIGYLSLVTPLKPDYYQLELKSRWEEKFDQMSAPGHRFSYTDLSSSNFSIPAALFKMTQGFVSGLSRRDDYEFCIHLINLRANFSFSRNANGFQQGEATNLKCSLKRKREEGKMDVRLWSMHPDVMPSALLDSWLRSKYAIINKNAFLLFPFLKISDAIASCLLFLMVVLEKFQMRGKWKALNNRLHRYWYFRGWLDEFPKTQELYHFIHNCLRHKKQDEALDVDLKPGFIAATQLLDQLRPSSINVQYGKHFIGTIPARPGAERIKGHHLRQLLAVELSESLMTSLALDEIINSH